MTLGLPADARSLSRRYVLVLAVAVLLGGCATSVNSLTQAEIGQIRINEIRVSYAANSEIQWEAAEEELAAQGTKAAKGARQREPLVTGSLGNETMNATMQKAAERGALARSAEGQAFLQRKVTDKIVTRLKSQLQPKFNGTRPLDVEVQVHAFVIPSTGQKIMLGGTNMLGAVTVLRDPKTGRELGKLDRLAGAATGNGWLGAAIEATLADPAEDRIVATYAEQVETWLLNK